MSHYRITQVSDFHYRIGETVGNTSVFSELLLGGTYAAVIDTAYGLTDLHAEVRRLTSLPLLLLNTHGHPDHACGNFWFPEPVHLSPEDFEICRFYCSAQERLSAADAGASLPGFDRVTYLSGGAGSALLPVSDGQAFDLGGFQLEAVAVPGHTRGCISFLDRVHRELYVGDSANGSLLLQMPYSADLSVHISSLQRMLALPCDRLWQAHVPAAAPRAAICTYLNCAEHADYASAPKIFDPLSGTQVALCVTPQHRQAVQHAQTLSDLFRSGLPGQDGFAMLLLSEEHAK